MPSVDFHGRTQELTLLDDELERAAAGRFGAVLIDGEAGIGKTRLAAEVRSIAERRGVASFLGRAEELGVRPFGALAEAFACTPASEDGRRAKLARLLAGGTPEHDPGLQHRIVDAFVDLIEREAPERGALLVVDDLQWADSSTLLTLRLVARRLTFTPLLLVGLFRPVPRRHALERLVDALTREGARQISLGPLASEEVEALVREVIGAQPGPRLSRLLAGTAGNPLFISELLSVLDAERALESSDGHAEVQLESLPASLRLTVLRRIGYLRPGTIEILRIAAVLGRSFAPRELAAATERSMIELIDAIEEAQRAGVLAGEDDALRFRHDVIREALYGELSSAVRSALHADVARNLAAAGASPLRVAEQYRLGGVGGDVEAIAWLRRAAEQTVSSDPAGAIELLRRAVELAPPGGRRDELRAELAGFHAYGGDPRKGEKIARELLPAGLAPAVESGVRAALVQALMTQGRWADVVAHAQAACEAAGADDTTRGRLLAESALARIWTGDLEGATSDAREAVRLGERTGDPVAVSLGLGHLSGVAQHRGDLEEAVELGSRGVAVADLGGPGAQRRHPQMAFGMALVIAGRLREAVAAFNEGRRRGEQLGTVWHLPVYHCMLALALYDLGEWDDAVAAAETSLVLADDTGARLGSLTSCSVLAGIAVHHGDLAGADRAVAAADAIVAQSGPQWGESWLTVARAGLLAAGGDAGAARRLLEEGWRSADLRGSVAEVLLMGPPLARLAPTPVRRAIAARMREAATRARVAHARAAALLCRGLAADDPGALLDAVELYRTSERAPDVATACADAAAALARRGRAEEARPLFDEALSTFEALGAAHDVARVAAEMRAAGIRRGARGRRGRPASGWEALTPAELRVANLVAEALTNREIAERLFVSRDTVKTHLGHIFLKLDIASRRALASEARRRAA